MKTLYDLFEATLKDVYYAEAANLKALPKMIKAVKSEQLKSAFTHHLEETKNQVGRLDKVFKIIDVKPQGKKCPVIDGLVKECEDVMVEAEDDDVRDAGVLACAQAVEHYEISRYGTLRSWADCLELKAAVGLLQETLGEEKHADEKLSGLAYGVINAEAENEGRDSPGSRATLSKEAKNSAKQRPPAGAAK